MKNYIPLLKKSPLFAAIDENELPVLLGCLGAVTSEVAKGGFALLAGDKPDHIGILLDGKLEISREDAAGNRALIASLNPGDFYGEALACAGAEHSPVSVSASQKSTVLRIAFARILISCPNSCGFHTRLIVNMVGIIARKNLVLQSRMEILDKKTIRERLLLYLSQEFIRHGSSFAIPFDRAELSEYLAVDRSALSREMGRLRDEGIIEFKKNMFSILAPQLLIM